MSIEPSVWFLGSLALFLAGVCWLLFKLIAHLRQTKSRYRWFELFTCLFLVACGFFLLLRVPRDMWSPWWAWFAGGAILSGAANLGIVLRDQFATRRPLRCSFCNKSQRDVKKLIKGPTVYICDECVDICVTIIKEDKASDATVESTEKPVPEGT